MDIVFFLPQTPPGLSDSENLWIEQIIVIPEFGVLTSIFDKKLSFWRVSSRRIVDDVW